MCPSSAQLSLAQCAAATLTGLSAVIKRRRNCRTDEAYATGMCYDVGYFTLRLFDTDADGAWSKGVMKSKYSNTM